MSSSATLRSVFLCGGQKGGRSDAPSARHCEPGRRGRATGRVWQRAIRALEQVGIEPTVVFSKRPGDARRLAAAAGTSDADLVVAVGGDGTANEVANGLVGLPVLPPLGFVQTGSGRGLRHRALRVSPMRYVFADAGPRSGDLLYCRAPTPWGRRHPALASVGGTP